MNARDRNLRIFLQSQAGLFETMRPKKVQVDMPGEFSGNAVMMGMHTVTHGSPLIVRKESHQRVRYYDPAHDGQRSIISKTPIVQEVVPEIVVEEEEVNLQGFQMKEKTNVMNPFADIGIVYEDENVIAEAEEPDTTTPSNAELNASNVVDPETLYAELLDRNVKSFGISREELAAFNLTAAQVKALFVDVIGSNPNVVPIGKQKRRIRDVASKSFSDYTRVINAIKKVREK